MKLAPLGWRAGRVALAVALGSALGATMEAPAAEACSCMPLTLSRTFSPTDGSQGVPVNAPVRVFLRGFKPELRPLVAQEMRLRVSGGAIVPTAAALVATRVDLLPAQPLEPNTRYAIEQLVAYDEAGGRLTDTERYNRANGFSNGSSTVQLAWFEVASFKTGSGKASTALTAPLVHKHALHHAMGGGDCGPANSIWVELDKTPTPELGILELEVKGQGVVATLPPGTYGSIGAGNSLCAYDKVWLNLKPAPIKARVQLRGISGKTATTGWFEPKGFTGNAPPQNPLGAQVVSQWQNAPRLPRPQPVVEEPLNCPFGLESAGSTTVADKGGPWMYEGLGNLGQLGSRLATVIDGPSKTPALQIGHGAPVALLHKGSGPRAWFDARGVVVAATDWRGSNDSEVVVSRVSSTGKARWTVKLGKAGETHGQPRVVSGNDTVLVVWHAPSNPSFQDDLCWATIDDRTGKLIARAKTCAPTSEGYPAVAYLNGHFLIAHHRRGGGMSHRGRPELLLGPVSGQVQPLALGSGHGGMDMAVVSDREVGIVAEKDREIIWAKLAPDGRLLRGPQVISRGGTNRKPRIAWGHGHFVVAWESFPGNRTYAVALDRFGKSSPATELFADGKTSTVAITSARRGFAAGATRNNAAVLRETLRCRSHPSKRAPDRIEVP